MTKAMRKKHVAIGCALATLIIPALLCITLIWVYPRVMSIYYQDDIADIESRYIEFEQLLDRGEDESAYLYMSPSYRQRNTYSDFSKFSSNIRLSWRRTTIHPIRDIWVRGNRGAIFPGDASEFWRSGPEYDLKKVDGEWYFTGDIWWYED